MILALDFSFLHHPCAIAFYIGLALGLVFTFLALQRLWDVRRDLSRSRKQASTHLELASQQYASQKEELEKLRKETENLRHRIVDLKARPGAELRRELEIYARAEQQMVRNAPGFAQAWQAAKEAIAAELAAEDAGQTLGKRVARALPFLGLLRRGEPKAAEPVSVALATSPAPGEPAGGAEPGDQR